MAQISMEPIAEVFGVTISSTALALEAVAGIDADDVAAADEVWIQVEGGGIRSRTDGTSPTVSAGWLTGVADGRVPLAAGNAVIKAIEIIRDGTSNATVNIGLYKWG